MTKRMLIDAAHPEETRIVVLDGNRLVEFDYETSTKKQIKGNIYLAKVTRVEPSLQAAFVEYGGNRHGFLAFNEIHPDYYRIPVADREAALAAERSAEAAENRREAEREEQGGEMTPAPLLLESQPDEIASGPLVAAEPPLANEGHDLDHPEEFQSEPSDAMPLDAESVEPSAAPGESPIPDEAVPAELDTAAAPDGGTAPAGKPEHGVETVGGDEIEEARRPVRRPFRHYKIQEVIKRRQIMLVQVTKEERGNKGAALTTYISLAGRYCVLMPNTPRGGGVSRKITSAMDRRRLKELMSDLEVPEGMGIIVRTAGSERSKLEIKRDFEYLRRLWDEIRELTLKSTAPALIYEEGNLIKRAIRDIYSQDIPEVVVDGAAAYENAKSFMKMLMPSHAKRVKLHRDPTVPLFHRFQIESQLDAIHSPTIQLKSGGYVVFNPTEALVAIDVNSGRSTRERNIEETATKTNLEAADEIARQLRLRDLAGLIVIDFIDMEHHRNQHAVERRLKEAMRHDRARIQLGRISPFGLLEMSRQRLRPSLIEASTQPCPYCEGTGHIRSTESTALHVLRAIEEEGVRRRSAEIAVAVPEAVALYILNQKRATLQQAESRYHFRVTVKSDDTLIPPAFKLDRVRAFTAAEIASLPAPASPQPEPVEEDEDIIQDEEEAVLTAAEAASGDETAALQPSAETENRATSGGGYDRFESFGEEEGQGRRGRRRRRRGRRGGKGRHEGQTGHGQHPPPGEARPERPYQERPRPIPRPSFELLPGEPGYVPPAIPAEDSGGVEMMPAAEPQSDQPPELYPHPGEPGQAQHSEGRRRRRRGRRGGRRRRRHGQGDGMGVKPSADTMPDATHHAGDTTPPGTAAPPSPEPLPRPAPAYTPLPAPPPPAPLVPQAKEASPAPERQPIQVNVPTAREVTGHAANPKKGWWRH
jgi:ribonuclease E